MIEKKNRIAAAVIGCVESRRRAGRRVAAAPGAAGSRSEEVRTMRVSFSLPSIHLRVPA
jgi:hypothetical protein